MSRFQFSFIQNRCTIFLDIKRKSIIFTKSWGTSGTIGTLFGIINVDYMPNFIEIGLRYSSIDISSNHAIPTQSSTKNMAYRVVWQLNV